VVIGLLEKVIDLEWLLGSCSDPCFDLPLAAGEANCLVGAIDFVAIDCILNIAR
jgi:hypothetical protein